MGMQKNPIRNSGEWMKQVIIEEKERMLKETPKGEEKRGKKEGEYLKGGKKQKHNLKKRNIDSTNSGKD